MTGYSPQQARRSLPLQFDDALLQRARVDRHCDRASTSPNPFEAVEYASQIARLEHELEALRRKLRSTIRDLGVANAAAMALQEEARTANEGCRSLSCELAGSREKLKVLQQDSDRVSARRQAAALQFAGLTARQRQIMDLVLAGHPSKNIAADLHVSQRTVDSHRAAIMKKTGSKSIPALIRKALAAEQC
jgi:DNA-binding CsgD family transcriptional regulator